MAMGSGAFLVQAARYLSERMMEAWEVAEAQHRSRGQTAPQITPEGRLSTGDPTETLIPHDAKERQALALRLICDRCLYGVDKNPMAVEMAKLSLWLVTLDKERPFTFLDHALRRGDSLLGISDVTQLRQWTLLPADDGRVRQESFIEPVINLALAEALRLRREIEARPVEAVADAEKKERLLREAEAAMDLVALGADLLVGSALAPDARERERLRQDTLAWYHLVVTTREHQRTTPVVASEREEARDDLLRLRARAADLLGGRRPFHWPLEFPEVFVGAQSEGQEPGFSAIMGNPPFMGGQKITGALGTEYREYLVENLGSGQRGSADLCAYFFLRAGQLVRASGDVGLLATNTIAQGDTREVGLDQLVASGFSIPRAVPSREWPGTAALEVAHVWLRRGPWHGPHALDDQPAPGITAYLTPPGTADGKPYRLAANADKSFQGSNVLGLGFTLLPEQAKALIARDARNRDVLFPYLNGEDLNSRPDQSPSRWVINFHDWPLERAETYADCMAIAREKVKPERDRLAAGDATARDRARRWWQFARPTINLYATIAGMERMLVTARVSAYHFFSFVPSGLVYADRLAVIASDTSSDYCLLSSSVHEIWAQRPGATTHETRNTYFPTDTFETFPFPDDIPSLEDIGDRYYTHRKGIMLARQEGLTKTYNRFHNPREAAYEIEQLRALHVEMDEAVARAYGWGDLNLGHGFHETKQGLRFTIGEAARREVLGRLLRLNHERHAAEVTAGLVDASGKPPRRNGKGGKNGKRKKSDIGEAAPSLVPASTRGLFGDQE